MIRRILVPILLVVVLFFVVGAAVIHDGAAVDGSEKMLQLPFNSIQQTDENTYQIVPVSQYASISDPLLNSALVQAMNQWQGEAPVNNIFYLTSIREESTWAIASLTLSDLTVENHEAHTALKIEDWFKVVAVKTDSSWRIALPTSDNLQQLIDLIPTSQLSDAAKNALFSSSAFGANSQRETTLTQSSSYKLPWHVGEPWIVTQGWHDTDGAPANHALDFALVPNQDTDILASAAGFIDWICAGELGNYYVVIKTEGTNDLMGYLHIDGESFRATNLQTEVYVEQGQFLGKLWQGVGSDSCGTSTGPHLHLNVPYKPIQMDSYTFDNNTDYSGNFYSSQHNGITRIPNNITGTLGIQAINISRGGRYIVFTSSDSNLVPNDNNGANDVFLYDTHTETMRRISVGWNGAEANGSSGSPFISADGQTIVYISHASNIDPNDDNNSNDAFIFNLATNQTERIVMPDDVRESFHTTPFYTDIASVTSISDDGNRIALLALYGSYGYVYDHQAKHFYRVTQSSEGIPSGQNGYLLLSANGEYAFFNSNSSALVPNDTNNRYDGFRHDLQTRETIRVTVGTGGVEANDGTYIYNGQSITPSSNHLIRDISHDGNHVLFTSPAKNIYSNPNNSDNLFLYDIEKQETKRIPIDPYWWSGYLIQSIWNPRLSEDGSLVVFQSGNDTLLANEDTNDRGDVFLYEVKNYPTPTFELVSRGYDDGFSANDSSDYPIMPYGNRYVYFKSSATNLTDHSDNSTGHIFVYDREATGIIASIPKELTYEGPFDDEHFVTDQWSSLDIFTEETIEFPIFLDRYYFHPDSVSKGEIAFDEDGFLTQDSINSLVLDGAFVSEAELVIEAHDVDGIFQGNSACESGETVFVEINGHRVQSQYGDDLILNESPKSWVATSFNIPISHLKFPQSKGVGGNPPESVANIITLILPDCNDGVAVAWGYIKIDGVIQPILTIPGWTDGNETDDLENGSFAFAPFYRDFGLNSHLPIQTPVNYGEGIRPYGTSAQLVYNEINKTLRDFGVDEINIFGHSRGGLFTRRALNLFESNAPVENVFSFSTPHHGSWPNNEDGWAPWLNCLTLYDTFSIERQWCIDSANSMTLDQMREFNFAHTCDYQRTGLLKSEWLFCTENAYAWQVPNVNYYSIAGLDDGVIGGVIARKEETAIFPWASQNWQSPWRKSFPHAEDDKNWGFAYTCENYAWIYSLNSSLYNAQQIRDLIDCHSETAQVYETFCFGIETIFANTKSDIHIPDIQDIYTCKGSQARVANAPSLVENQVTANVGLHQLIIGSELHNPIFRVDDELAGGEIKSISLPISATVEAVVTLQTYPDIESYSLWDPMGNLILTDGVQATKSIITNTEYGNFYQYRLIAPTPGQYNLQITNSLAIPVYYAVSAVVSDTTNLNTWTEQYSAAPSDTITVTALLDGYTNQITITADITDPDGLTQTIQLSQNISVSNPISGYVVYDGAVTLSTAEGFHHITTRAESGYLVRLANTSIAVYSRTAQIGNVTQITLPDMDNNNLYDSIDFDIEFDVLREGYYALFAELVGPAGEIARTNFSSHIGLSATLPVTTHLITLSFPGEAIYASDQSGPYTLTHVTAIDENGFGFTVDTQDNVTTTAAYLPQQFEGERTVTLDSITYETTDDNINGLYETIQFTLTADSQLTGTFRVSGRLVDEAGGTIGWASSQLVISDTGAITPTLVFSGSQISGHQEHGIYALRDLNMLSPEGTGWYESNITTTIPYSYTQFEGLENIAVADLAIIRSSDQITITWPDMGINYEVWLTDEAHAAPNGDCLSQSHCTVQAVNQYVINIANLPQGLQTAVIIGIHNGIRTQNSETAVGAFKFELQPGD